MGELVKEGVSRPVGPGDLALYEKVQAKQVKQQVPMLQHSANSHEYLFLALFDGTGQDMRDPGQLLTNVGVLAAQLKKLGRYPNSRLSYGYVEGIGTQREPLPRLLDGVLAYTWSEKIERLYRQCALQVKHWRGQDPQAQVRIVGVGYSRGAVLVPGLAQLVDRYGIVDPDHLRFGRDKHGNITLETDRPPLVAPGETAQAVALFDPVATGMPRHYDARLPPSVISAFSLMAAHEKRNAFPHHAIADQELAAGGRILGATVPGGHSNVGGGNRDPGLESIAFNLVADYLNGLRDQPFIEHRELPGDPGLYTVYQARGITAVPGLDRDGTRNLREELANCTVVDPCRDGEAMNQALAGRFEYRPLEPSASMPALAALAVQSPEQPGGQRQGSLSPDDPAHPDHALLQQIRRGVQWLDVQAGKPFDEASERLSRALLLASKGHPEQEPDGPQPRTGDPLRRADHVLLGADGRYAFVVEGGMDDPAHRFAMVEVARAVRMPLGPSDLGLESANRKPPPEPMRGHEQHWADRQGIDADRLSGRVPVLP